MVALSHVILHLSLCAPIARTAPETSVAVRVRMLDHRQTARFDQVLRFERGDDDNPKVVEFDAPVGTYYLDVAASKFNCSAGDFITVLADHNRSVDETLAVGPAPPVTPFLFAGSSPQSFLYAKPTFVLLDKSKTACNKPIGDFIPLRVVLENDQDAYYAALYTDSPVDQKAVQLALRLKTPTHQYHYVRIPPNIPFGAPWAGWPDIVEFDVTQDEIDHLAGEPIDTLLCLHLWETKVYF
jgi:hypothetical protein